MSKKRVAVIGAGVAGLVTLRHLADNKDNIVATAFDRRCEVGGVWNYSDQVGTDKFGLPVPYNLNKSLLTNVPRDVIGFPDFPFPPDLPKFMHFQKVRNYLEEYVNHFNLKQYIKFGRLVASIKPSPSPDGDTWLITTRDTESDESSSEVFDVVIVCNGVHNLPYTPALPGLDVFQGPAIHSKDYRVPEKYLGMRALVVGASYSAWDIVCDLKDTVDKLYVSCRKSTSFKFASIKGVEMVGSVDKILPNGVILDNGECREVDVIFFATGYLFHIPFLAPECNLQIKNDRITPLYRHMFHIQHPSLVFINYIKRIPHFQASDLQARYACAVLRGDVTLPAEVEMLRDAEEDFLERVIQNDQSDKFAHLLCGPNAFSKYVDSLANDGKLKPLADVVREFELSVHGRPAQYGEE